jgi:protein involved in ribonucleotide reduction
VLPIDIVYFSNYSGNTKKFVERLSGGSNTSIHRIGINAGDDNDFVMGREFVLFVPTYGGGSERSAVPRQVRQFLNREQNRNLLRGVVGFGNTNFGEHFCKAADIISSKTNVPVIARVEIFGTEDDLEKVKNRLEILYGNN